MDLDAYVAEHAGEWRRLEALARRRKLSADETDELIALYQRAATHLSVVRSRSPDPALVARLSRLVLAGRSAITGTSAFSWRSVGRFFTIGFPLAVYRAWPWWSGVSVAFSAISFGLMAYVTANPEVAQLFMTDAEIESFVNNDFAAYYSENPAGSFALQVWVNNAWVAAQCIGFAILLGLPIPYILFQNAANLGVVAGLMFDAGKGDVFLGLLTPHGLLELTAVFLAGAVGMRLGWTVIAPGDRPRAQVLAEQGRAVVAVAVGLVVVLLISGLIEALVTPSPLPTVVRIGIGVAAEAAFLGYVGYFGSRAVHAGETGDVEDAPDVVPTS